MVDFRDLRIDQIGSLSGPPALYEVFDRYKQGAISEQELDRAKDDAVRHVVAKQVALGLPFVTDGELRRRNFQESFGSSVRGFEVAAEDKAMAGVTTAPLARQARRSSRAARRWRASRSRAMCRSRNTRLRARSRTRRSR
jgi:methionine synthase II (cobalamin-independent)